jgi:hypothetical protein
MQDGEGDDEPRRGTNADRILRLLREHPEQAFRPTDIAERLDIPAGSIGPTLGRLRERGRVEHNEPYWILSDHEQATDAATGHAGAALAAREDANEQPEMEEWQAHAVDPREHRSDG